MTWQPIDTAVNRNVAPWDGTRVLLYLDYGEDRYQSARWSDGRWLISSVGGVVHALDAGQPTLWKPIEPPEAHTRAASGRERAA